MSPDVAALVALLGSPAAWVDDTGAIVTFNEAFEAWAPGYRRAVLQHRPGGFWLVANGRPALAVRVEPTASGHLVLASGEAGGTALEAVVTNTVRRVDRVRASLEATLAAALREQPAEPVVAAVHEALAVVEELRSLRQLVLGLAPGVSNSKREAVNLGAVAHEAVAAMTGPLPLDFGHVAPDCVVDAVREKVFWALAALVGSLTRAVTDRERVSLDVEGSAESGRVVLRTPAGVPTEGLDVAPARDAVETAGGRLLIDPDGSVVLQFPAFTATPVQPIVGERGTILVVDDDPSVLALMGAVLRRDGWGVLEADNGVAASALLRTRGRTLRAFVTDAVLPGRSGAELVVEARRWLPRLPVLMVTGHDEELVGSQLAPVLRKPFSAKAFRERVAALVAGDRDPTDTAP